MIFQKKIIIGSIMSFVATAVGVIAVFFPDLFNLQKKKMEALSIELNNQKDFDILSQFLEQRAKDRKLFQLKVAICDGEKLANDNVGLFGEFASSFVEDQVILAEANSEFRSENEKKAYISGYYDYKNTNECNLVDGDCEARVYQFPRTSLFNGNPVEAVDPDLYECPYALMESATIKGYFVFDPSTSQTYKMRKFTGFSEIPEKDVMLKDY